MLFDKFSSRIVLNGTLVAETPIHIGTQSDSLSPLQIDSPVLKDGRGRPVIPGSSLKGVIRSIVESILSNPEVEGYSSCSITDKDKSCSKKCKNRLDEVKGDNLSDEQLANIIYETSCDTCRLFGNSYIASKIQFKDAYLDESIEKPNFERRDGVGIDRDTGVAVTGAKYDFEIVPAGSKFKFSLICENLDDEQRAIFDMIKGFLMEGEISIGGKVSRGLGKIKLIDVEEKELKRDDIIRKYGLKGGESIVPKSV